MGFNVLFGRITQSIGRTFPTVGKSGIWNFTYNQLTHDVFQSLGRHEKSALVREAQKSVSPNFARAVHSFTDCVQEGLKSFVKRKNFKFVSIGQSPAVIAEALSVRGVDTAICPISKLGKLKPSQLAEIAKSQKFDKYIAGLKSFGIDLSMLDKNTDYIFVDYTVSKKSLKNFEELLKIRGISGDNIKFVSLQDIIENIYKNSDFKKRNFLDRFIKNKIHNRQLKERFSPIFTLPVEQIGEVSNRLSPNINFNQLKLLLYNLSSKKPV